MKFPILKGELTGAYP